MHNGKCKSSAKIRGQLLMCCDGVLPTIAQSGNHSCFFSIRASMSPTVCQVCVFEASPVYQTFLANANKSVSIKKFKCVHSFLSCIHQHHVRRASQWARKELISFLFCSTTKTLHCVLKRPHSFEPATPPNLGDLRRGSEEEDEGWGLGWMCVCVRGGGWVVVGVGGRGGN